MRVNHVVISGVQQVSQFQKRSDRRFEQAQMACVVGDRFRAPDNLQFRSARLCKIGMRPKRVLPSQSLTSFLDLANHGENSPLIHMVPSQVQDFHSRLATLCIDYKYSRGSVIFPARALAATVAGEARKTCDSL